MIGKKCDRVFCSLKVMLPMVESMDDSKQFMVVDVTVLFCRGKSLGKVSTRMEVTVFILLHENLTTGQERSICHDDKGAMNIRELKYQGSLEFRKKNVESVLLFGTPRPGLVFACQSHEGSSNIGKSRNKLSVKVTEAQER